MSRLKGNFDPQILVERRIFKPDFRFK